MVVSGLYDVLVSIDLILCNVFSPSIIFQVKIVKVCGKVTSYLNRACSLMYHNSTVLGGCAFFFFFKYKQL